ncbi:unnamed protein product [Adineta steineri]|uniref:Asteroid domain-containing protein n=2 Tax=Adineta steineri TaxID=433720 RepID=A0A816EIW2_9BILA|nr:unnamed protein product [Adineta steineri]CAF1519531.1 unnamed protein product [Adineta steineri]CAF1543038.1 unnamed protein product [Adineta steineri]CAF1649815.1 unnamed protein product [Adineta steineri]
MGIRGLETFIRKTFDEVEKIKFHNCNVVIDGDSIYHQMYQECELTCVFAGEYDQFYQSCIQLFESFEKCQINAFVVFDGAQLDSRKESTMIKRAEDSIVKSTTDDSIVSITPRLLHQTFISVLDAMQVPYISALGEADDECVSLANHFNCYLMATDSDYFCYNLHRGYIPFESLDINPKKRHGYIYLTAQLYHIDSLLEKFEGLQPKTLALACCLCGNDYIDRDSTIKIIRYMNNNVETSKNVHNGQSKQTQNLWNAMEWMRKKTDVDEALGDLLIEVHLNSNNELRIKIEEAVLCYLEPSDTLIYRFNSSNNANPNLLKNPVFVQLAQSYLDKLDMNDNQREDSINEISQNIKSKCNHSLPLFLADTITDLRLSSSFIEIFIRRQLICKALIEVKEKPSIFTYAIPIVLPCFTILLKWDKDQNDSSVVFHHRKVDKLEKDKYSINIHADDIPELEQIWTTMSIYERQGFVRKYLEIPDEFVQRLENIPSDFHLWLMIIYYWYIRCKISPVYLYAVFFCFIKCISLRNDPESMTEQFNALLTTFNINSSRQSMDLSKHEKIFEKFEELAEKDSTKTNFNKRTTYELNCLQVIYLFSLRLNDFFNTPFRYSIYPQDFISGSLFYGFVKYCQEKHYVLNMNNSMDALFGNKTYLVDLLHSLYNLITSANVEKDG